MGPPWRVLVGVFSTGAIAVWDVSRPLHPTPLGEQASGHDGGATAVAISPDGRAVATVVGTTTCDCGGWSTPLPATWFPSECRWSDIRAR
jgi:hypothetical protein